MRKCRKCKITVVVESRKYCDKCKLQKKICSCGEIFKSKKWVFCKKCRGSYGETDYCNGCGEYKKLYWSTKLCQGCYKYTIKYNINKETIKQLKNITNCQICGITVHHQLNNSININRAVIDHCHKTGRVRGILCNRCNVIDGMLRDVEHLNNFYQNYQQYINNNHE